MNAAALLVVCFGVAGFGIMLGREHAKKNNRATGVVLSCLVGFAAFALCSGLGPMVLAASWIAAIGGSLYSMFGKAEMEPPTIVPLLSSDPRAPGWPMYLCLPCNVKQKGNPDAASHPCPRCTKEMVCVGQ